MKRTISSAVLLGVFAFPVMGLVGCGEETKVEEKKTVSTPEGTKTITNTSTVKETGSNLPGGKTEVK